jgi:hypothetical protein
MKTRSAGTIPSWPVENGQLAEHWDVIEDEATKEASVSGLPMFGDKFPARHTKIESTVRYLGVDVEDALALAEGAAGQKQAGGLTGLPIPGFRSSSERPVLAIFTREQTDRFRPRLCENALGAT